MYDYFLVHQFKHMFWGAKINFNSSYTENNHSFAVRTNTRFMAIRITETVLLSVRIPYVFIQ